MPSPAHRRADARRPSSRPLRATALASGLVTAIVATLLLVPASAGWSATFDGTLSRGDRTDSRSVRVDAGKLRVRLAVEPTVRTSKPVPVAVRLITPDGRRIAKRRGHDTVVLRTHVSAARYRVVVSTPWPLKRRDLDYRLRVRLADTSGSGTGNPPPANSNAAASCGTWVLYQVDSAASLRTLRPQIEDALALPGVVGLSVRFPWDAADLTGGQSSNAILDEAYDISSNAGKALSIRFMAGAHTPQRVFDAGAAYYLVNGRRVPLPWDDSTGRVQVFLDAYAQYAGKLAAWSRAHGVRLLHLSWYGLDWAELNNGAEVRAAPGYSKAAWQAAHEALIDIGLRLASDDLAVELPLSGYGPLSSGESDGLASYAVDRAGADNDRFFIQANGWDETRQWGAPDMTVEAQFDHIWQQPLVRGLQMIQPDGYDWAKVYDQARAAGATYGEVYLPSFWQVPGPTAQYNHNTTARIAQLEKEIAAFARDTC